MLLLRFSCRSYRAKASVLSQRRTLTFWDQLVLQSIAAGRRMADKVVRGVARTRRSGSGATPTSARGADPPSQVTAPRSRCSESVHGVEGGCWNSTQQLSPRSFHFPVRFHTKPTSRAFCDRLAKTDSFKLSKWTALGGPYKALAAREGLEPPTFALGKRCSILLSYRAAARAVRVHSASWRMCEPQEGAKVVAA